MISKKKGFALYWRLLEEYFLQAVANPITLYVLAKGDTQFNLI